MQWILAAQKFDFVDFVDFLGFLDFLGDLATPMKLNGTQTIHFLMLKRLLVGIVWIHGITPSFCGIGLVVFVLCLLFYLGFWFGLCTRIGHIFGV
jgi:hypothetical protein